VKVLYLIGLGLWDEKDLTARGKQLASQADKVYWEAYTDFLGGTSKQKLEEAIGKEVVELDRKQVEEKALFLEEAREKKVALLVGGDPMVATTHQDLVHRARQKGVDVQVVHNASIYSAVTETGLQAYKFGRTATVVFWQENFKPTSFYDAVKENLSRGLHSLLLLDIKPGETMTPRQALETLVKIDSSFSERKVVVVSRLGSPSQAMVYGQASGLLGREFGSGPHAIVVPGQLHDVEKEALESLKNSGTPKGLNKRSA
jgi:diphthine synthase